MNLCAFTDACEEKFQRNCSLVILVVVAVGDVFQLKQKYHC